MVLAVSYQIKWVEGEYHLYMLLDNVCAVLYSGYLYKDCIEVMQMAKHMQKLKLEGRV